MIVTVTQTIMDGQVVRWYASETAEDRDIELASASRNQAIVSSFASADVAAAANDAHQRLKDGEDLEPLATHKRWFLFGPLEPVVRPA